MRSFVLLSKQHTEVAMLISLLHAAPLSTSSSVSRCRSKKNEISIRSTLLTIPRFSYVFDLLISTF